MIPSIVPKKIKKSFFIIKLKIYFFNLVNKKIEAKKSNLRVVQVVVLRLKRTKKSKKATNHDNCNLKWPFWNSLIRKFEKFEKNIFLKIRLFFRKMDTLIPDPGVHNRQLHMHTESVRLVRV
jgi:hypothetical protein